MSTRLAAFFPHELTVDDIGLLFHGGVLHSFYHMQFQPVIRIYEQHIVAVGFSQSGISRRRQTSIFLMDDLYPDIQVSPFVTLYQGKHRENRHQQE